MESTRTPLPELRTPLSAKIGAGLGFIGFLLVGLIPGLLYGGYMGLIMAAVLFGAPVEPSLVARFMTGGGMLLGLAASLFLFVVVGAVCGTLVGFVLHPVTRAFRATGTEVVRESARN